MFNYFHNAMQRQGFKQILLGFSLLMFFIILALFSIGISDEGIQTINLNNKFLNPSWQYWFGTDQLGRDIFLMLMKGAQTSLITASFAVFIAVSFGVSIGAICFFSPNWLNKSLIYTSTLLQAFPAILTVILLIAIIGPGAWTTIFAIGLACVPVFIRLTLACSKDLFNRQFILAARSLGRSNWQIFQQHLFPNMLSALLVQASVEFVIAILAEAALSYLGLGVQPPTISWGRMLSEAQSWLFLQPQLAIYPGVAIVLVALAVQWLNDGVRDFFDIHRPN